MGRYKRIQIEEREEIMKSIAEGKSLREIARELNRKVSSISREIKRNKKGRKGNKDLRQAQYSANKAQEKAQNRQKERHKKFVLICNTRRSRTIDDEEMVTGIDMRKNKERRDRANKCQKYI